MMGGKALQDVLLYVDKRMKNTTQDTRCHVLKNLIINSLCFLSCVYLFQKKESELGG